MRYRWELLNGLSRVFSLGVYLEIGVRSGLCINQIEVNVKHGVDIARKRQEDFPGVILHHLHSDRFFEELDSEARFDLIFIDGCHSEGQVSRDISNSLGRLSNGGFVVCHDCNPKTQDMMALNRNGECWQAVVQLRISEPNVRVVTFDFDHGLSVICLDQVRRAFNVSEDWRNWNWLNQHRQEALNLVPDSFFPAAIKAETP